MQISIDNKIVYFSCAQCGNTCDYPPIKMPVGRPVAKSAPSVNVPYGNFCASCVGENCFIYKPSLWRRIILYVFGLQPKQGIFHQKVAAGYFNPESIWVPEKSGGWKKEILQKSEKPVGSQNTHNEEAPPEKSRQDRTHDQRGWWY